MAILIGLGLAAGGALAGTDDARVAAQQHYLEVNRDRPGWHETPSGLQYHVVEAHPEGAQPTANATVLVHYEGRFIDGQVFDSSIARGEPLRLPLDKVIPGWTEGVSMMHVGETWEFAIPARLAYGESGKGQIPGGSTLLFRVTLLSIDPPSS